MKVWKLRRTLYRAARRLGDVQAAQKGPGRLLERQVKIYLAKRVWFAWW